MLYQKISYTFQITLEPEHWSTFRLSIRSPHSKAQHNFHICYTRMTLSLYKATTVLIILIQVKFFLLRGS